MIDIIKRLPDSVANQIAAGEVIQRPASVIKELVENAVDAGATEIRIFIKDSGRTLIQVVDNGRGMSETDARMAFERHATSKIRSADDLFTLKSMGFRGEALPSICAISQVEVRTRTHEYPIGTRLVINGSNVETQEPCACDAGTSMMVKNIFFNVPARRKFLKSDSVELSNIMREFERLALVNNNVRMCLDTGSRIIDLRAASFKQRIGDIWKNNLDLHLLPIEVDTSLVKISGFISRPEYARRRNPLQYLIVNGRNMQHPYFRKAILNCYDSLIAADTQPCFFLKFEVDPASIDVNIHPTKNEIKFEYEQEIWPILQAAVKAALGKHGAVPSIDFDSDVVPVSPLPEGVAPERPQLDIPKDYNPFREAVVTPSAGHGSFRPETRQPKNNRDWETLYDDFLKGARGFGKTMAQSEVASNKIFGDSETETNSGIDTFCVQHALRYIITTSREGLLIIDQHRAHVKILYEGYLAKVRKGRQVSQRVMFPETVSFDPEQQAALSEVMDSLVSLGFTLEYVEDNLWRITTVPSMLSVDAKDVVCRMLDSVSDGGENYGKEDAGSEVALERMALVMARASAVNRGKKLTSEEMEHLVGELFSLPDPAYTPNGSPVYKVIDARSLENMFRKPV